MKAKDTLMSKEQIDELWLEKWDFWSNLPVTSAKEWGEILMLRQAEISFKLGIEEAVEWMSQQMHLIIFPDNKFFDSWQAQLKEWGIKND